MTEEQLLIELERARQRIAELENLDISRQAESEQQRLLAQLEKERARFEAVLRYMPAGVIIAEAPSGKFILSNDQAARIWERPILQIQDVEQYCEYETFHPDGRACRPHECPLPRSIHEGEVVIDEERGYRRGDGTRGTMLVSSMPIRDRDWHIYAAVAIFYDITYRKQMEQALRESETKYRSLLENIDDIVCSVDARGTVTFMGSKVTHYGWIPDEIVAKHFSEFVLAEDRRRVMHDFRKSFNTGGVFPTQFRSKDKEGRIYWFEERGTLQRDEAGKPIGVTGILRDITNQKEAETALRESEQKFKALSEQSPNMIFIYQNGRVLFANKKCEEIIGYSSEKLCSPDFDFLGLIAPEYLDLAKVNLSKHRSEDVEPLEYALITRGGRRIEAILTTKLLDYEGESRILGIISDITKQKQVERKLIAQQEQLRALAAELSSAEERERRKLAAMLHDDIAQALAICKLKLEAPESAKSLHNVVRDAAGAQQLLETAIRNTRSLMSELSIPSLYDLGLEAALEDLCERMEQQHGIRFAVHRDEESIPLDPELRGFLYRAVRELLINVFKHARARRSEVTIRSHEGQVQILVADDGIGFDCSEAGEVPSPSGGFGLFYIRQRLHYLGGSMKIKSSPAEGTTVKIELQLRAAIGNRQERQSRPNTSFDFGDALSRN